MAWCYGDGNMWLCLPPLSFCVNVQAEKGWSVSVLELWRFQSLCVCVCMCTRVCVYVHAYVSPHPWVIVQKPFSLQKKIEAQLREVSHELELSGVILFSPPPPGMLRDAWTYFMHSTWNGVLTWSVLGERAVWHRQDDISSKVFCVVLHSI